MIGGYCLAKFIFFDHLSPEESINNLRTEDVIKKLASDILEERHPLAEDILKSLVFLCPIYTKKQLFEVIDKQEILSASLSVLRIIVSDDVGQKALIEHFKDISPDNPIISHLFNCLLLETLKIDEHIGLTELLVKILLRLKPPEIDLYWSEVLRKNSNKITSYILDKIENFKKDEEKNQNMIHQMSLMGLFLSSTKKYLRDIATKALVIMGQKYPDTLFDTFKLLQGAQDLYILERLTAALCGVFVHNDNKELLENVCKYIENNLFLSPRTTHILILDYIDFILDCSSISIGFKRTSLKPSLDDLFEWETDYECTKELDSNEKAAWGYGPIDYNFAKDKIGFYLSRDWSGEDSKLPQLKDSLSMIIWRIKEFGYTKEIFQDVDKNLSEEEHKKYRYGSLSAAQRYGEKYCNIAFYERYGQIILEGIDKELFHVNDFRVSSIDIDPTFPSKPLKRQLITCCLLPKKDHDIQEWINKDEDSYFEDYYNLTHLTKDESEWIMLYGSLIQKDDEKTRIKISGYSFFIPSDKVDKCIEQIETVKKYLNNYIINNLYVMAGEIPWSKNLIDGYQTIEIDGSKVNIYLPVSYYYREHQASLSEDNITAFFPSKNLSQDLNFNINDFNLYTNSGDLASSYIHDDYSDFLYFRKDLLEKYLIANSLSLVWIEEVSKYASFGKSEPIYDPPINNFSFVRKFT